MPTPAHARPRRRVRARGVSATPGLDEHDERSVDRPASEWSRYLANVVPKEEGAGPKFTGELSKETIDAMSEEQRMMLRKLKEEAQSFGEAVKADEETK